MAKKFYIKTFGCKVNQYESQMMREDLLRAGFQESSPVDRTDIFIVNTCTVTKESDTESRRSIRRFYRDNKGAKIIAAGCGVEQEFGLFAGLPGIAHIVKNNEKSRIASIVADQKEVAPAIDGMNRSGVTGFEGRTKAFVKIQDGCAHRCSYCRVCLVRGPLASKAIDLIRKEVSLLVDNGFKEIVVAGICLGAWGIDIGNNSGIEGVLKNLETIQGDFRIRLSSIEPKYITDSLIRYLAMSAKVCRHLHIPLQSGDDSILRNMNRSYTVKEYMSLVAKIRKRIPSVSITTDVIVGFPGETDESFAATLRVIKELLPARIHIFSYSPRKGTAAFKFKGKVKSTVVARRFMQLKTAALEASFLYRSTFLQQRLNVLVETSRDKISGMLKGYTDNYIKMLFSGPDTMMGRTVSVTVEYVTLDKTIGALPGNAPGNVV